MQTVFFHALQTSVAGWLEAFGAHPRIGDAAALKAKMGGFADASRSEQAAAAGAPDSVYQVSMLRSAKLTIVRLHLAAPCKMKHIPACRSWRSGIGDMRPSSDMCS